MNLEEYPTSDTLIYLNDETFADYRCALKKQTDELIDAYINNGMWTICFDLVNKVAGSGNTDGVVTVFNVFDSVTEEEQIDNCKVFRFHGYRRRSAK